MSICYRTKDGMADYKFSFEKQSDGSLRAYIEGMPSYGARDPDRRVTHRNTDGSRMWVCWDTPIYREDELRQIVAVWSDLTQTYIKTGKTIDEQARELRSRG